jgi:D-alanyl-D-alanine carboxypeptidase/D-alanyl-D-alanine-endopeptidase (penicillin-binding protein 4)
MGRFAGVLGVMLATGTALGQSLQSRVQAALGESRLGSARIGLCILDVDTGRELASMSDATAVIPASNLKLITSGSALLTLGAEYQFQTRLVRDGNTLIVVGSGDPGFADPELLDAMRLSVDQFMDRLVQSIKDSGMTRVDEVVIDDRVLDRDRVHPDWPANQLNLWYCAEVSGLNFHANVLQVYARPGERADRAARIRTEPAAPWLDVTVKARTVRDGNTAIWAERDPKTNAFTIHGTVKSAPDKPIEVTVTDGASLFGKLFAERLARAGLGSPTSRIASAGERLDESGAPVASVATPMSVVLERCNGDSHNLYAEALLKVTGHTVTGQPGSWSSGAAVARMHVRDLVGPEASAQLVMADGSGLSRNNRVTASLLCHWLAAMSENSKVAEAFLESLPKAGGKNQRGEGTLSKRFQGKPLDNEVLAKTGFINGVRSLSGYVTHPSGRRVAFSVIVNDLPSSVPGTRAKEFHEKVVLAIDDWLDRTMKDAPAPGGAGRGGEALGGNE